MSHANAALTPRARLRLARLIVEDRWPATVAAKMFMVSPITARKWAARFRAEGAAGMTDRSSRPLSMPGRTPARTVKQIVRLRWRRRLGPAQISEELGIPASTVHAVLVRCRISRVAYVEICSDEKAVTAIGVLERAVAWFADRGVTVERVLSDNGSAYKSFAWRDACAGMGITHKRTRPYRPQTNGKIERFHRTLADGWAYARFYRSDSERRKELPGWVHFYNHHRRHSAIVAPPISRLNNLPGHHN